MSFPERIKVSGLPFMFQGWNNIYYKTSEIADGCPVYSLPSYTLYGFIEIIGVTIYRNNGIWVLQRVCDANPSLEIKKYGAAPQPDPFCFWAKNMTVKPQD